MVGIPGLEPGTFAVSVQCSNQMSYIPMSAQNVRIELTREAFGEPTVTLTVSCVFGTKLTRVEHNGVEPLTSAVQVQRSSQLS